MHSIARFSMPRSGKIDSGSAGLLKEASQDPNLSDLKQRVGSADAWSFITAAVLAAFYLGTSIYIASHRLLWFDELLSLHLARLPDWTTIPTALARGADTMPPAYHIVVRIFDKLF